MKLNFLRNKIYPNSFCLGYLKNADGKLVVDCNDDINFILWFVLLMCSEVFSLVK